MSIRRLVLAVAFASLPVLVVSLHGYAAGHFDGKLSPEQQIQHALSRLTFGARPGDTEEVRRMGLEKWIALQLHPERIAENPTLEDRLKPLETIRMDSAEVLKQYNPQFPVGFVRPTPINELLPGDLFRKVYNGTAEERATAIKSLDPDIRVKVLAQVPTNVTEGLPDLQKEAAEARKKLQEELQMEARKMRPPLNDLLDPAQQQMAQRGTPEQRAALFASLDPVKLRQVAAALPPQALADQPLLRRQGMMSQQPQQLPLADLREARLYRAIYSNRQLEEVLVDFWLNHFNVYQGKGQDRTVLESYERDAIRPHVLGKFKDLLLATAHHPAMLFYLDNWESMSADVFQLGPFAPGPFASAQQLARQARGLNENYGRELMELQTLGVDGGYTQQDVIAVARCFTGWTIRQPNVNPEFAFAGFMHDAGEKTVLGHKIPAGGMEQDGLQVIDILAHHPSTARFISLKLARRFVADNPPPSLVDRMARAFTKTDGDIRAVLETMFTSREFFSEGAWQAKIKSPLETVVSAVRALNGTTIDTFTLVQKVSDMGEPLYDKVEPTGYRDTTEAWLSTAGVIARIGFATTLTAGQIPGVKVDLSRYNGMDAMAIAGELLNRNASPQTQAALEKGLEGRKANPAFIAGLVISSPEFQRR